MGSTSRGSCIWLPRASAPSSTANLGTSLIKSVFEKYERLCGRNFWPQPRRRGSRWSQRIDGRDGLGEESPFVMSKDLELPVKEGELAPLFSAKAGGGVTVRLEDLRGQNVVLYFYPRDNTPGCTIEACRFRDQFEDFKKRGVVVLGVSADSAASHDKFTQRFCLPFALLADEDKSVARAYGAWGEKSFLGRKYMGIRRITFLIGPDGRIRKIWRKVKIPQHAGEVLAAASEAMGMKV
jgi:peroxiredoxin Q/BCP